MNIYLYTYYKIYKFTNKLGNWEVANSASYGFTFLLGINSIYIYKNTCNLISSLNCNKEFMCIIFVLIIFINIFLFLYKSKYKKIIAKYSNESEKSRKIGNILVTFYVFLTFISIFFIPKGG